MGARVTVVIVTYKSATTVGDCLRSVPAAAGDGSARVVVVDNASGDGTVEAAYAAAARLATSGMTVTVVERDANGGFAVAANEGLRRADGDYVLFLNPDAV